MENSQRIIKFRAWDKKNKNMVFSPDLHDHEQAVSFFSILEDNADFFSDDDCILQQYTGLKDKNGKEIYEGDIVNHLFYKEIGQVIWNEKSARFVFLFKDGSKDKIFQVDKESFEIIGNIYENPELIK